MRVAVCSDLHLEFGDLEIANDQNADVLVLGGDIFVAQDLQHWVPDSEDALLVMAGSVQRARAARVVDFVNKCAAEFKHVVLIMGNHEHYHGDFSKTANVIRGTFGDLHNVHFLDNEWRIINGVLFFGGTLWTNMNNEDPQTMHQIRMMMNDYNGVRNSAVGENCKFMPQDSVEDHYRFRRNLDEALAGHPGLTTVVVGHHAPSRQSTHPKYKNEVIMNGAYSTDLDNFILERPQIKLWTHGHTHEDFDYMVGDTRIVCNPRGYVNYEDRADTFTLKYIDV